MSRGPDGGSEKTPWDKKEYLKKKKMRKALCEKKHPGIWQVNGKRADVSAVPDGRGPSGVTGGERRTEARPRALLGSMTHFDFDCKG